MDFLSALFGYVFGYGFCLMICRSEARDAERKLDEAARLQSINREREARGLPIIYNPDLDR